MFRLSKTAVFVIALLISSWSFGKPASPLEKSRKLDSVTKIQGTEKVSAFLSSQKKIRAYISSAPGYGHQSATFTVMKRFRQLGYHGEFEVIYQDEIASKLSSFMIGFDPAQSGWQKLSQIGISAISYSQFQKGIQQSELIPLGITGADDNIEFRGPEALNVKSYIRLEPQEWGDSVLQYRNTSGSTVIPGLKDLGFHVEIDSSPEGLERALKIPEASIEFGPKVPAIRSILLKSDIDFGVIYGIGLLGNIAGRLKIWVEGLQNARKTEPQLFRGGIVLPIFSHLNEQEISSILWEFGLKDDTDPPENKSRKRAKKKPVEYYQWNDPGLVSALEGLSSDQILLVQMDRVPPDIFEIFVNKSRIPLLVAGKNTMNLAQSMGRPYINTVGDYNFPNSPSLSPKSQTIFNRGIEVFHYSMTGTTAQRRISAYLRQLMDENSELAQMFQNLALQEHDKVAEALQFYVSNLKN